MAAPAAFGHRKYVRNGRGEPVPVVAGGAQTAEEDEEAPGEHHDIHLPSPSYFPLIASLGPPVIAFGFIYDFALVAVGAVVLLFGLYGWALEPAAE